MIELIKNNDVAYKNTLTTTEAAKILQLFISISLLMAAFCSSISICLQAMISVNISVIV